MFNKKYELVDIKASKKRELHEEALNRICYPAYFVEGERGYFVCCFVYGTHTMIPTGRKRRNVSHFECQYCGKKEAVDDTFARPWR